MGKLLNTATARQRWALYCITKKDYRDEVLSKEEASRLIEKLGKKDYEKKPSKSIEKQLEEYLVSKFDEVFNACLESLKIKSVVEEDKPNGPNRKRYAFFGFGCSINYFTYRKNNKKAKEIADAGKKLIYGKIEDMFVNKFSKKEQQYYENIGCPLRAIFSQDQNIQSTCHYLVTKFAEEKGVKLKYVSVLD